MEVVIRNQEAATRDASGGSMALTCRNPIKACILKHKLGYTYMLFDKK